MTKVSAKKIITACGNIKNSIHNRNIDVNFSDLNGGVFQKIRVNNENCIELTFKSSRNETVVMKIESVGDSLGAKSHLTVSKKVNN